MSRTPLGVYADLVASREMGLKSFSFRPCPLGIWNLSRNKVEPAQALGWEIAFLVPFLGIYSNGLVLLRISLNINNENTSIRVEGTRLDAAAPL